MKKNLFRYAISICSIVIVASLLIGCQKTIIEPAADLNQPAIIENAPTPAEPNFNLEAILRGEGNSFGHVKFRQDNDIDKIVSLDVWVRDLEPNHEYKLRRAVDVPDNDCTSTSWLILGQGLTPQSIITDETGSAKQNLWRNLSAFASGTSFDIHFQVIDAATSAVVLNSDCYQFTVR